MTSELRPAVEVWRDATEATCLDPYVAGMPHSNAAAVIEADREAVRAEQAAEIAELRKRLEIPQPPFEAYDGIACRDETIRGLDAQLTKWKALAETLAGALEQIEKAPAWGYPDKWETTPAQVRILAREALTSYKEQRHD